MLRFLIVDDSNQNRKIIVKMLTSILKHRNYTLYDDDISKYSQFIHQQNTTSIENSNIELLTNSDTRETVLKQKYFHINEANDGTTAIDLITQQLYHQFPMYDYIFIDNIMITKNGPETVFEIRNTYNLHNIQIIGITGNGLTADIELFKNAGLNEIFIKPLSYEKLKMLLQHL